MEFAVNVARTLFGAGIAVVCGATGALAQGSEVAEGGCRTGVALIGGVGAPVGPQTAQGSSRTLSLAQCRAYCEQLRGCAGFSYRQDESRRVDERGLPARPGAGDAQATCALFWSVAGTAGAPGTTSCLIGRAQRAAPAEAFSKFGDDVARIDREVRQDMVRPPRLCLALKTC